MKLVPGKNSPPSSMGEERPQYGSVELSRNQVVRLVSSWIQHKNPAAVVRFGEGEGRLLTADSRDPGSVKTAAKKLRRQTGLAFSSDEVLEVKSLVMKAFDEADVLGIRGSNSFNDEHKMWVARIESVLHDRLRNGRKRAYVSHCLLNNELRAALPTLLDGQQQVSVISCRNVKQRIQADYGVPDVRVAQIPSQYVMRDVDGEYEAALHDVPIWPHFYKRLSARLTVRQRGEIFLVGAGILGKGLCIRVRELGGIALDMGSCLDRMAGKVTRGPNRPKPYNPSLERRGPS
jgi:hypothetical protein